MFGVKRRLLITQRGSSERRDDHFRYEISVRLFYTRAMECKIAPFKSRDCEEYVECDNNDDDGGRRAERTRSLAHWQGSNNL